MGFLAFLWGFIVVFIGGLIIYKKLIFNLELMLEEDEDWLD
tara:strand:+ start:115 stop:237 length:123 start_codon:yes stop_codon:yes gene_type:complete